jgi:hypothetical protein
MRQMKKEEFQKMYMNFLKTKGYSPVITDDGDVAFEYNKNQIQIVIPDEDMPNHFYMIAPQFDELENDDKRNMGLLAINYALHCSRFGRVYESHQYVSDNKYHYVTADVFNYVNKPNDFQDCFDTLLSYINMVICLYEAYMDEGHEPSNDAVNLRLFGDDAYTGDD